MIKATAAQKWLEFAERDIEAAKILFQHGNKMGFAYQACVFHCHQTVEKLLKAIIVSKGLPAPKTHDLVRLAKESKVTLSISVSNFIRDLNPHYQISRYPDMPFVSDFSFAYKRHAVGKILNQTKKLYLWLEKKTTQS